MQGWVDGIRDTSAIYTEPNRTEPNHEFGVTLHNATHDIFTFVRYPDMPPTNNTPERTLMSVILHKKIQHMFRSAMECRHTARWNADIQRDGMQTYSAMECRHTARWNADIQHADDMSADVEDTRQKYARKDPPDHHVKLRR